MINFLMGYGSLTVELSRLLKMRFTNKDILNKSKIGKSLVKVLEYHNRGQIQLRDLEIAMLQLLAKQLKNIEDYDTNLLKGFRRQIHRNNTWEQYFGIRMEINIAASLINKNAKFDKAESPDFIIHRKGDVYIECGSIHIAKPNDDFLRKKISSVISKKSNKSYCNSTTALCVDTTNIFFHSALRKDFFTTDVLKGYTKDTLKNVKSEFGSVILFAYMLNQNLNRYESNYLRIDNKNIDEELMKLLNDFFPLGKHTVDITAIPEQG